LAHVVERRSTDLPHRLWALFGLVGQRLEVVRQQRLGQSLFEVRFRVVPVRNPWVFEVGFGFSDQTLKEAVKIIVID